MKKTIFAALTLALCMASAKTYPVTLSQPVMVAGTLLKPGEYVVDVKETKAVFKRGKVAVECAVKVEKASEKYASQSIRFAERDGKIQLQELRLGGTDVKLVVD
jgi:hypothetical protein